MSDWLQVFREVAHLPELDIDGRFLERDIHLDIDFKLLTIFKIKVLASVPIPL
jgi:hypothetical protein